MRIQTPSIVLIEFTTDEKKKKNSYTRRGNTVSTASLHRAKPFSDILCWIKNKKWKTVQIGWLLINQWNWIAAKGCAWEKKKKKNEIRGLKANKQQRIALTSYELAEDAIHWWIFFFLSFSRIDAIRWWCVAHMDESSFFIDASSLALFIRYFSASVFIFSHSSGPVVVVCTHRINHQYGYGIFAQSLQKSQPTPWCSVYGSLHRIHWTPKGAHICIYY